MFFLLLSCSLVQYSIGVYSESFWARFRLPYVRRRYSYICVIRIFYCNKYLTLGGPVNSLITCMKFSEILKPSNLFEAHNIIWLLAVFQRGLHLELKECSLNAEKVFYVTHPCVSSPPSRHSGVAQAPHRSSNLSPILCTLTMLVSFRCQETDA